MIGPIFSFLFAFHILYTSKNSGFIFSEEKIFKKIHAAVIMQQHEFMKSMLVQGLFLPLCRAGDAGIIHYDNTCAHYNKANAHCAIEPYPAEALIEIFRAARSKKRDDI